MMMFVIVGWQLGLVAPRSELVLLVSVRWAPPDFNVDVAFMASHGLVVGDKEE